MLAQTFTDLELGVVDDGSTDPAGTAGGGEAPGAEGRLWSFTARHTEPDALVFTDSFASRYETRRSITGSFKDGGIVIAGTGPFYRWYVYMREVEDCRRRRGEGCWFALAEKYQGRYAVWIRSWIAQARWTAAGPGSGRSRDGVSGGATRADDGAPRLGRHVGSQW